MANRDDIVAPWTEITDLRLTCTLNSAELELGEDGKRLQVRSSTTPDKQDDAESEGARSEAASQSGGSDNSSAQNQNPSSSTSSASSSARHDRDGVDASRRPAHHRYELDGMEEFVTETDTTWDDIGGHDEKIQTLKRTIALGSIGDKPDAVAPGGQILLYGPPGTGKTLMASAVAGALDATFFQVEASNVLSKWYGESSEKVSKLFEAARTASPSVIFLDEVDSLAQSRDGEMHETSRRVLDTLLGELDGIEKESDDFVLTLAATNTPWDLDPAIRSRFPQRIYVPLPDREAATDIVRIHTIEGDVTFAEPAEAYLPIEVDGISVPSPADAIGYRSVKAGYTGRDIEALCTNAIHNMVSRANPDLDALVDRSVRDLTSNSLGVEPLKPGDFDHAFDVTPSSIPSRGIDRYKEWKAQYGSGSEAV